jgi:hypothetical protein
MGKMMPVRCRWMLLAAMVCCAAKAEGSCAAPSGKPLEISGDFQQGNLHGTFRRTVDPANGRFTEADDLGIVRTGSGFDGRLAWLRDVSGASHFLTSDFARRLARSEAWITAHLTCPPPRHSAGHLRIQQSKASGFDVWRFRPPRGAAIELWYDRHSSRLDRAILQYSENRIIHHYADWRQAEPGFLLPFAQRDEDPEDESESVYTVRHVGKKGSAFFGPPPLPNDSRVVDGRSTTIPFEDDNGRRVYLPVYLNGKGPFAFELDNGGHFILTAATAKELGLSAQGSFNSTGAGNEIRQSGYVQIGKLRVGNAVMVNQTAKVLSLSHNERPGLLPRAGILGLEFFERFIVGVDHRNKTVSLEPISGSPVTHPGTPVTLLFDEDAPLVAGGFNGAKGNVMLDIGNAGPTIVEYHWAEQYGVAPKLASGTPVGAKLLFRGTINLGPFTLKDVEVVYFGPGERGSESTHSIAAVVGEPLLFRYNAVYDYARQTVWLEPLGDAAAGRR